MKIDRKLVLEAALVALVALGFCWAFTKGKPAVFHPDEAHKISETYYYYLFFARHDFSHPDWTNDFYARVNPPVAKYIMGAFLSTRGHWIQDHSLQDQFNQYWLDPNTLQQKIPPELLKSARLLSAIFGALTLVVVYLIGRLSGNALVGLLGATVLFSHPFFQYHSAVALTDIILLFFMSLAVLVTFFFLKDSLSPSRQKGRPWAKTAAWIGAAALIIAAATGTKLNGALAGILFVSAFLLTAMTRRFFKRDDVDAGRESRNLLLKAGTATALAILIFVSINPYFYPAPFARMATMLTTNHDWMLAQRVNPGEPLWQGTQKISAVAAFDFAGPQRYLGFGSSPLLFVAFSIGMGWLLVKAGRALRKREFPIWEMTVLLWVAIYGIGIALWIPVDWDRYFLPLVPFIAVVSACGIVASVRAVSDLFATLLKRNDRPANDIRWIAGAAALSLILWHGLVDYSLLPPTTMLWVSDERANVSQLYEAAERKSPGNPLRALYAADANRFNDPARACELYRRAMNLLELNPQGSMERIMLVVGQYRFAQTCLKLSRLEEARNLLQTNVCLLKNIKGSLKTQDPDVLNGFDILIRERELLLAKFPSQINGPPSLP